MNKKYLSFAVGIALLASPGLVLAQTAFTSNPGIITILEQLVATLTQELNALISARTRISAGTSPAVTLPANTPGSASARLPSTPTINSLSTDSAPQGSIITAYGSNFTASNTVRIDGVNASTSASIDGSTLFVPISMTLATGNHTVAIATSAGLSNAVIVAVTGRLAPGPFPVTVLKNICYDSASGVRCTSTDQQQEFDACLPQGATSATPAVLLIHGGGWSVWASLSATQQDLAAGGFGYLGATDNSAWSGLCANFASHGIAAFPINYRGYDTTVQPYAWPAQIDDIKMALQYIKSNSARFNIQPSAICAEGNSAGGELAAFLGTTGLLQCVIDDAGPVDIGQYQKWLGSNGQYLSGLFGDAAAMAAASPLNLVTASTPPTMITHGLNDHAVPASESTSYYQALVAKGVSAKLINYDGGHIYQNSDGSPWIPSINDFMDAEVTFVKDHIGAAKPAMPVIAAAPTVTIAADKSSISVGQSTTIRANFVPGKDDAITTTDINETGPGENNEFNAIMTGSAHDSPMQDPLSYAFTPTQPGTYLFRAYGLTNEFTFPNWQYSAQIAVTVAPDPAKTPAAPAKPVAATEPSVTIAADNSTMSVGQSTTIRATFTPGGDDAFTTTDINEIAPDQTSEFNAIMTGSTRFSPNQNPLDYTFTPTQPGTYLFRAYGLTNAFVYPNWQYSTQISVTVTPSR